MTQEATFTARTEAQQLDFYRRMRDTEPVALDAETKFWHVYRYADVSAVLSDHERFSSDMSGLLPGGDLIEGNILRMDPPRHHRLRSLVSKAFTPAAIGRMEGRIAQLTHELLDDIGDRTHLDLVTDLSYPLPVIVIADMLGVPSQDRDKFRVWADALLTRDSVRMPDEADVARVKGQMRHFTDYLGEHVARRRVEPRADLLTDLVRAEIDGEMLGDPEIVGFATVLLLAGHITTTALLGNAIRCLDEHPDVQAALRADPDRIALAVEEVLRYRSPFALVARATTADVTLSDTTVPARRLVMAWIQSANRDERQFPDPDRFVMDRQPNAHVGFGRGIHFCLGAPLARLESRVALGVLLEHYADIRLDPERPPEGYITPGFNSSKTLHLIVRRTL